MSERWPWEKRYRWWPADESEYHVLVMRGPLRGLRVDPREACYWRGEDSRRMVRVDPGQVRRMLRKEVWRSRYVVSDHALLAFEELPPHPRDDERWPPKSDQGDDLSSLLAERNLTVRRWREITRCRWCGAEGWEPDGGYRTEQTECAHGCCAVFRCPDCGHYDSGFGGVGCPCDDGI